MWLFDSPNNYSEMVSKISKCVFVISLIVLYLLCQISPDFNQFMEEMSFGAIYEIGGLKLNFALLVCPLLMGTLEHMFKIHDKISMLFRIRRTYDEKVIATLMIEKANYRKHIKKDDTSKIMKIFYTYASSTEPKIDSHYIVLALNEWCWFWIMLDVLMLSLPTSIVFLVLKWSLTNLGVVLGYIVVMLAVMTLVLIQTKDYSKKEVFAIFNKYPEVKKEICDALCNK